MCKFEFIKKIWENAYIQSWILINNILCIFWIHLFSSF